MTIALNDIIYMIMIYIYMIIFIAIIFMALMLFLKYLKYSVSSIEHFNF